MIKNEVGKTTQQQKIKIPGWITKEEKVGVTVLAKQFFSDLELNQVVHM